MSGTIVISVESQQSSSIFFAGLRLEHGCLSVGYTYGATDCRRIRFLSLKRILVEIFVDESYSCPQSIFSTFLTSLIEFSVDGLDFC